MCHRTCEFLASHVLCGIFCYSYKGSKTPPRYHHHFCKYLVDYYSVDRIEFCDHYITCFIECLEDSVAKHKKLQLKAFFPWETCSFTNSFWNSWMLPQNAVSETAVQRTSLAFLEARVQEAMGLYLRGQFLVSSTLSTENLLMFL